MTVTDAAAQLPGALLDGAAFPGHPARVELRETHISWVFLAGDRAYKVKKPLVLPFLDYGTRERRRDLCEEEVRVNRRLAPGWYLGVAGIEPAPGGGLRVGPPGADAVEHAVEMRRYDEAATLAVRLIAGTAGPGDLERVGARLAAFHAEAPPVADDPAADLAAVVAETLNTLRGASAGLAHPGRLDGLERFARAGVVAAAPLLHERAARGLARDGHGDLRAEHVLLGTDGAVDVVDALEFDPALRRGDVAYDLAFLMMDLERAGGRLVAPLLRGYRRAGGDCGPARLLALLVAVRALVRAKVDLLRAAQLPGAAAAERRARAEGLLAVAERAAWGARLPPVLCVAGLSASGKSTVAAELSRVTGRPVLSSDVVRKRLAGVPVDRPGGAQLYHREMDARVYRALAGEAATCAAAGPGAIVDATFRRGTDAADFLEACHAETGWMECRAPAEVRLERARRRRGVPEHGSDAGEAVVRAQLAGSGSGIPLPGAPLAVVDTTEPLGDLVDRLAERLDHRLLR